MKAISILLKTAMVTTISLMMVSFGIKTPSVAVSNYFAQVKKGDKSNDLLKLKGESSVINVGQDEEEMSDVAKELLINSLKQLEYTINNEDVDGERAVVNVTVKGPNITNGMVKTIQESFKKIFEQSNKNSYMSEEEGKKIVDDIMIENFKQLEVDERTADVILVKSDDGWVVEDNEDLCNLILGKNNESYIK